MMDVKTLTKSFPLMSFKDPKTKGCLDQNAGILYADRCLKAFQVRCFSQTVVSAAICGVFTGTVCSIVSSIFGG